MLSWEVRKISHTHTVARDYKTKYQKDKREIWLLKIVKVDSNNLGFIRCLIVKHIASNEVSKLTILEQMIPFYNFFLSL